MNIRPVTLEDAPQVAELYNYYVKNTHHTFEYEPLSLEEIEARINKITAVYPFLVAEENGEILGYSHAARFKLRQAYEHTSEVLIYVKNDAKKRGVGTALYMDLFDLLEEMNIHVMIAGIALPNDSSVKFHERLGFTKAAHFKEIGYKLGRWFDVGYWQFINRV
jgi:phosphinothricin acetyltransferase